jgi:hypothetical protein
MFTKTTPGEWVVIGLSVIFGLIGIAHFAIVLIASLVILYIFYRIVKKVYPKSEYWGFIPWIITLAGIPILIILIIIMLGVAAGFASGLGADVSGSTPQLMQYSNYGISFNYPSNLPQNTSAPYYSNSTYYRGQVQFDNFNHQGIAVAWFPLGNGLTQESVQKFFSLMMTTAQRDSPDSQFSPIQETSQSGNTVYYITGQGHDITVSNEMGYIVIAIWEDPTSQRFFVVATASYESLADAQSLFNDVLTSIQCH